MVTLKTDMTQSSRRRTAGARENSSWWVENIQTPRPAALALRSAMRILELTVTPGLDASHVVNWSDWSWKLSGSGKWAEEDMAFEDCGWAQRKPRQSFNDEFGKTRDDQPLQD